MAGIKSHMNKKIDDQILASLAEGIHNSDDIQLLVQELLSALASRITSGEVEGDSAKGDCNSDVVLEPTSGRDIPVAPWADAVADENEARVMDLYSRGMSTRDISNYMKLHHEYHLDQSSLSTITDKVYPLVQEWQSRVLDSNYPIVYFDGIHYKVRDSGRIVTKVVYVALGISLYGHKELLGIWVCNGGESAKFWMSVLTDIKNRGVEDIFITCVDGLKGFPDAIRTIFPRADIQVCVAHQIRHTVMFLPLKDRKRFCDDLRAVYTAANEPDGRAALNYLIGLWPQYEPLLKSWEKRWDELASFFSYPQPIRRMIYTTNTIENLNRQFRKVTKTKGVFPHDDALTKLLWLSQAQISQHWTTAVRGWGEAIAQLSIIFPERIRI